MRAGRIIDHVVVVAHDLGALVQVYEALGFAPMPRAIHPDVMGTRNHLVQFSGRNFIELLEVDRPRLLADHDFAAKPPRFSFGAHHRAFAAKRAGMSMLLFASDDARADMADLAARGIATYAPFDFERRAKQPDGSEVTLAFSLGYATDAAMPDAAFAFCHNKFPQHFWKPAFQSHPNGARGIAAVYMAATEPAHHKDFLERLTGARAETIEGGFGVPCGAAQRIVMLKPEAIRRISPETECDPAAGPLFVGLGISTAGPARGVVPPRQAGGVFIEWRAP